MKPIKLMLLLVIVVLTTKQINAQSAKNVELKSEKWTVHNREVGFRDGKEVSLSAKEGDGVLWLNDFTFSNGTIELDIKGKDMRGQSFVGIAFHGQDNDTFDGIYFRPFNFESSERKTHSIQYISMPDNDWSVLRKAYPDKYENTVDPVPNPNKWFHARIEVDYPSVKVYVDDADASSLEIEQISDRKKGDFGLWVGNGSEGWFRNVVITPMP